MRLWDYRLIKVLSNKMLISEWRECIAIKRQWEKGTLKHRLVSYVTNHSKNMFVQYVGQVKNELTRRGINYKQTYWNEFLNFADEDYGLTVFLKYPEHNDRYLKQCLYNLEEKYDRNIITKEEWKKIMEEFKL